MQNNNTYKMAREKYLKMGQKCSEKGNNSVKKCMNRADLDKCVEGKAVEYHNINA